MSIIEGYLRANWVKISGADTAPVNLAVLKLGGQSSPKGPLNLSVFVGDGVRPRYLVKLNRLPADFTAIENEFHNLDVLNSALRHPGGCLLPEAVFFTKIDGLTAMLVETFLPGRKINLADFAELRLIFSRAFGWLKEFYLATKRGEAAVDFRKTLSGISAPEALRKKLDAISEWLSRRPELRVPVSSCQGDFDFDNLLLSRDNIAILDWEDYADTKSAFFDAEFFIFNAAMYFYENDGHVKSFERFFLSKSKTYELADFHITEYCKFLGVDKSIFYIAAILDTADIISRGHGRHKCVPMQSMGFLEKLVDLALREGVLADV